MAVDILIVEDEPALSEVYSMILTLKGHRVRTAANGIIALGEVAKSRPDLILLDMLMPEMDGKEFLLNLDTDKYAGIYIIVCSNLSDQALMDEMLSLGAAEHVLKSSITPNRLVDLVNAATK